MKMKTNPVCWFEIYVQEMDRAKKFYETVLGTELTKLESPMPEIEMLAFAMEMDGAAQRVLWSKWMVLPREVAAPWSTSPATIVRPKHRESNRPVGKFTNPRHRSDSTGSWC